MKKIIFINSHPIQYFAPLYAYLNLKDLPASCWYCSEETLREHLDVEFGSKVAWDIPLLEGYAYRFFRNRSWKPSLYKGFFGLINPGMISALFRQPKSVVIVHGWAYLTNILVIIFGRLAGHTICLRAESPLNQELLKSGSSRSVKRFIFRFFLFPFIQKFLFIGSQNKAFYQYYGVKENRLLFTPYAVDNARFQQAASRLLPQKKELRSLLGLPVDSRIILFTAKFISKKRPMDLLEAYHRLSLPGKCLVMVGDGELRKAMEALIELKAIPNVYLPGFVNQTEIEKYYAVADVFVLCSEQGETWGLSVNEAMNFNLPVVCSDQAGCAEDLMRPGLTGFVFKTSKINDLKERIQDALMLNAISKEVIDVYSFETIKKSLALLANESYVPA